MARRWLAPDEASGLGRLDPEAIARVRGEAWPDAASPDELHDALVWLGFLTGDEVQAAPGWRGWLAELGGHRRAACIEVAGSTLWIAAERLAQFQALWPALATTPAIAAPPAYDRQWSGDEALVEILRGRLEGLGPVTPACACRAARPQPDESRRRWRRWKPKASPCADASRPAAAGDEWCERRLLARIHRYTIKRLRAEIEPVAARDFLRFLFRWQRLAPDAQVEGSKSLETVIAQLEGFGASGRRLGKRYPAGAAQGLSAGLARCAMPRRTGHVDAPAVTQRSCRRQRRSGGARAHDADQPAATPPCRLLAGAFAAGRSSAPESARPGRRRLHGGKRRLVLRRAAAALRPAALPARGGVGRAGGAGSRELRQLRRPARAPGAVG